MRGRSRYLVLTGVGVTASIALVAALMLRGDAEVDANGRSVDPVCPAPAAGTWSELAGSVTAVVEATVVRQTTLTQGETSGAAWAVAVREVLSGGGLEPGDEVGVWPDIGDGELRDGEKVILALQRHEPRMSPDTFDTRGVLVEADGGIAKLCKGGRSVAVDRSVVD